MTLISVDLNEELMVVHNLVCLTIASRTTNVSCKSCQRTLSSRSAAPEGQTPFSAKASAKVILFLIMTKYFRDFFISFF